MNWALHFLAGIAPMLLQMERDQVVAWAASHGDAGKLVINIYDVVVAWSSAKSTPSTSSN